MHGTNLHDNLQRCLPPQQGAGLCELHILLVKIQEFGGFDSQVPWEEGEM